MKGLDYFPLSCHMDDSVKLMEAEFGLKGFAFVIKMWQSIYSGEGYYKYFDSDVCLMLAKELSISSDELDKLVNTAVKRGIFDKELYENHKILTSRGIQSRFFKCAERRKALEVNKLFLLIDEEDISNLADTEAEGKTQDNTKSGLGRKSKDVCKKSKNADISKQSKEKKSKEEKSKEKESREDSDEDCPEQPSSTHSPSELYGEFKNIALTEKEYEKLCSELGEDVLKSYIKKTDEYVRLSGKKYNDYYLLIKKWHKEDSENADKASEKKSTAKRSKFNNYVDTNKYDYSHLTEEIIREMLDS